jgi:hypothetical protein
MEKQLFSLLILSDSQSKMEGDRSTHTRACKYKSISHILNPPIKNTYTNPQFASRQYTPLRASTTLALIQYKSGNPQRLLDRVPKVGVKLLLLWVPVGGELARRGNGEDSRDSTNLDSRCDDVGVQNWGVVGDMPERQ